MKVTNVHERLLPASPAVVGRLLDSLAGPDDRLWPRVDWPPMQFDRPLQVGAAGGHGPIRYEVAAYDPGRRIQFRFTGPAGFDGFHAFEVVPQPDGQTLLRHELRMVARGPALVTWPLVFRHLHDALIEDAFAVAADGLAVPGPPRRWSPWVRALLGVLRHRRAGGRKNPWLEIPLADYEGHMSLPQVGQARLLAEILGSTLRLHTPRSVAIIGCAGGNGFERISAEATGRVVAVDLNPDYVARLRERFAGRLPGLEPIAGDIQSEEVSFAPVELIFAGLILEYVDLDVVLGRFRSLLCPSGILATVIQAESATSAAVTPSPYASLRTLAPVMRLVRPDVLRDRAECAGFRELARRTEVSSGGKEFTVQMFGLPGTDPGAAR